MLAEQGKLALRDPVEQYLPESAVCESRPRLARTPNTLAFRTTPSPSVTCSPTLRVSRIILVHRRSATTPRP